MRSTINQQLQGFWERDEKRVLALFGRGGRGGGGAIGETGRNRRDYQIGFWTKMPFHFVNL